MAKDKCDQRTKVMQIDQYGQYTAQWYESSGKFLQRANKRKDWALDHKQQWESLYAAFMAPYLEEIQRLATQWGESGKFNEPPSEMIDCWYDLLRQLWRVKRDTILPQTMQEILAQLVRILVDALLYTRRS